MEYKLTTNYDGNIYSIHSFANALDAVEAWELCTDWGNAKELATYNLSMPDGKMYTKWFNSNGAKGGK
jgi:hypothetical protein